MKIIHYIKVACHFWPWEREFWVGLFHDCYEDDCKWMLWLMRNSMPKSVSNNVYWLSRNYKTPYCKGSYDSYINRLLNIGVFKDGEPILKVKVADMKENLKRCPDSLKKRYNKYLPMLENALQDNVNA